MIIPTTVSIFLALEVRQTRDHAHEQLTNAYPQIPQIVCFKDKSCAIKVYDKWYEISGVIDMESTIPDDYKLNNLLIETPETTIETTIETEEVIETQ